MLHLINHSEIWSIYPSSETSTAASVPQLERQGAGGRDIVEFAVKLKIEM